MWHTYLSPDIYHLTQSRTMHSIVSKALYSVLFFILSSPFVPTVAFVWRKLPSNEEIMLNGCVECTWIQLMEMMISVSLMPPFPCLVMCPLFIMWTDTHYRAIRNFLIINCGIARFRPNRKWLRCIFLPVELCCVKDDWTINLVAHWIQLENLFTNSCQPLFNLSSE